MEEKETKEQKPKQEKGGSKMPMVIVGVVIVVVVLVGGGLFAMKSFSSPGDAAETGTGEAVEGEEEGAYESTGIYYQAFDAFITCLGKSDEYTFTYQPAHNIWITGINDESAS